MDTNWTYAVELRREEGGRIHAYAAAMPDAIASGDDSVEALREMALALDAAVRGRIRFGMDLEPPPADDGSSRHTVTLPVALAAKAMLYVVWRQSGLTKVALAKALGVHEKEARRVLDPDHPTGLDRLASAAQACGYRFTVGATRL